MTKRDLAQKIAWSHLGRFYIWGGDDPSGFDCSGFVVEVLQSVGVLPVGSDATAETLRQKFSSVLTPQPGDLVFWLRNGSAFHVGMIIDPSSHYIGADGGRESTTSVEQAMKDNAFIKVRPIGSRAAERRFATPFGDI